LFKRNHQEHDFGIDGQIELVTEDGSVTGQMIAIQVKCGKSFFEESNKWGYIYRGERKHFNYLFNYPVPVIISICDPNSHECYWVQFRPEATELADSSWKITIPFENKLASAKLALTALVTPVRDGIAELDEYWKTNKVLAAASVILYTVDESDIKNHDVEKPRAFFDRLRSTKELASQCQSKVEIVFSGYVTDPRALWEIDEVRSYVSKRDHALPELFFFVRWEQPTGTLLTFCLCQTSVELVGARRAQDQTSSFSIDLLPVSYFLLRHFHAMNLLTDWLEMPLDEKERLDFNISKCLGQYMGYKPKDPARRRKGNRLRPKRPRARLAPRTER